MEMTMPRLRAYRRPVTSAHSDYCHQSLLYKCEETFLYSCLPVVTLCPGGSEAPRLGGKSKKAAALAAEAMKAQIGEISERVEALAASARHREKAQGAKEKSITLARTMETNGIRVRLRVAKE